MNRIKEFLIYLIATKERDARFNEMNHVVIPAKLDKDTKIKLLCRVHDKVDKMVMHFDTLRQRNLNFALIFFAGLFGFQVKFGGGLRYVYVMVGSAALIIMIIFFLIDFKYHVYSHGFQATSYNIIRMMAQIVEEQDMELDQYDKTYAATAELRSLQAIIYYALIIASIITSVILLKFPPPSG